MKIQILGLGCPKCKKTEKLVRKAVEELQIEAEVIHVSDPHEIAGFGVLITPGVVVDGEVKCSGKVPSIEQLRTMLSK